jgi:hypothetical protein
MVEVFGRSFMGCSYAFDTKCYDESALALLE